MKQHLLIVMAENPVQELPERTWFPRLRFANLFPAPAALLIVAMLSGGTAVAAEDTVPGDMLYPIKVHINEGVRQIFHRSPTSKADWSAHRMERRLAEFDRLEAEGRLTDAMKAQIERRIAEHADKFEKVHKTIKVHVKKLPAPPEHAAMILHLDKAIDQHAEEIEEEYGLTPDELRDRLKASLEDPEKRREFNKQIRQLRYEMKQAAVN